MEKPHADPAHGRDSLPIDDVYSAFLLRMDGLPPWLPGIQRIDITRFEKPSAHTAQVDYKWLVQKTVVPSLLRPFLRDNMDHIRSTTRWCAQRRIVEFEFFHDDYREWFDCYGTFALVEAGHNSMRIDIHAELLPYPERVPGPAALAGAKWLTADRGRDWRHHQTITARIAGRLANHYRQT